MNKINVTKTFLPPISEYEAYLSRIWENGQITNQGPLLKEFETKTCDYLGIKNFHFVGNGTIAIQIALNALNITEGEIITTPFSYVATTSAILWERCVPVFVDIEPDTYCIDADKIEAAITPNTKAILAVHVFGFPCDVDKIAEIAQRHNLKVIYDAAHAFGVELNDKSLLSYGDISTCSFHATKVLHTIEGGGVIVSDSTVNERLDLVKRFGHNGDNHLTLGINAKASEFQAAMGLCNLKHIEDIRDKRKAVFEQYGRDLTHRIKKPVVKDNVKHNYAYYPVLFDSEDQLLGALKILNEAQVFPRRYFYPSLNTLPYIKDKQSCAVSESVARRVLCLPLYSDLDLNDVRTICNKLNLYVENQIDNK